MITTLSGDNYYLINSEINKLRDEYDLHKDTLGLTVINASETTLEDLKLEITSYSLFSARRLIVVSEASKLKGFDEYLPNLEVDLPDSTHLVLIETSLDKRKSYY